MASYILLLDDDDFSDLNLRFAIVGVPSQIRDLFSQTDQVTTVANRINEIPEVTRLSRPQIHQLLEQGFLHLLGYKIDGSKRSLFDLIYWVSDGIAQHAQEIALSIANASSDTKKITDGTITIGIKNWIDSSIMGDYTMVESLMNARNTAKGRRNQTLYCLGCTTTNDFTATKIEEIFRDVFKNSSNGVTLNISQILT